MTADGFALFDTVIGRCGIAWGGRGILGVQLPETGEPETRARMLRRFPGAPEAVPPPEVRQVLDSLAAHLRGETSDLSTVVLDMADVPPFHRRVYDLARAIPSGTTLSYGEVATRLGSPGSARAVGQALGRNPFAIVVPCHRVLAAGGGTGGFSAAGGVTTKLRLLSIEMAPAACAAPTLFDGDGGDEGRSDGSVFNLDAAGAVAYLCARDAVLARLIDAVGPFAMEPDGASSTFGALAEAIVYQQLNAKAAGTIFARVCALLPGGQDGLTAEQLSGIPDEDLRAAGLSRSKLLAVRDLTRRTLDGEIPSLAEARRLDDEVIVQRLTTVRGIGRWTAEMFLMFRLGRPDVLPLDDYGIRTGFMLTFGGDELPSRRDLEAHGVRWQPYRTVASWYLWRAADQASARTRATAPEVQSRR